MKHPLFDVTALRKALAGTCMSIPEAFNQLGYEGMEEEDLDENDHQTLDDEIFRCVECDWWCENDEKNEEEEDENFCTDCRPNYE